MGELREPACSGARLRSVETLVASIRDFDAVQGLAARSRVVALSMPLDAAAIHRAFVDHASKVYRYACAKVGPHLAEDVVADTFAAAWKDRNRFGDATDDSGIEAWLIGIAHNLVARHRRAERNWLRQGAEAHHHQAREHDGAEDAHAADSRADAAARSARLRRALAHMPRRERDPLLLHVLNDMSYEDIARALDVPIGTVRSRISRGRARLAERLDDGGRA